MAATEEGQMTSQDEFSNSYGFAILVWDSLMAKYAAEYEHAYPGRSQYRHDPEGLWKWVAQGAPSGYGDHRTIVPAQLRPWELNVLYLTYDMAYIQGEKQMLRFAESCLIFEEALVQTPSRVTHLVEIAKATQRLVREGFTYLGFYGTSCGENLWYGRVSDGESVLYNFAGNAEGVTFSHQPKLYRMFDPARGRWCNRHDRED